MVVNILYLPEIYIPHYYHSVIGILKNSSIKAKIPKTEGLGRNQIHIYETYKNMVIPHGRHIYAK